LLELAGRWSARGNVPDPHDWDFLVEMVEAAVHKWRLPDHGIWEVRDAPRHFVHSKVMCWTAVHRGITLAQQHGFKAPLQRWQTARDAIRDAVETQGFDAERGVFVASFGSAEQDAALLLLPDVGFVAHDDPRMVRTAQAIARQLDDGGLVLRYRTPDGLRGAEGAFVPCTFWLAECFAHQGLMAEARQRFDRACDCANDLGLFSEQYSAASGELLGNFPQGLTHLAHISAALAIERAAGGTGQRSTGRSEEAAA
jgi:GH15 family glucan-1,4-alpha-glucosidase